MVYDTQITIVNGIYKPTNITGGPHIVDMMCVCALINTFFPGDPIISSDGMGNPWESSTVVPGQDYS
jgi:hypothetical protein